jgi:ElaB/YqjD/DUF883 family membrane-anchored ribosome-binding protein
MPSIIPTGSALAKRHFRVQSDCEIYQHMPEIEPSLVNQKLGSSSEHAKKALDAATEATRAVSDTVKKQTQAAIAVGKEHLGAAARDLSDAATATYGDLREQAKIKADGLCEQAQSFIGDASSRAQTYQSQTESYIRENPLPAVGIALGVGFLLGIILRR